jgi:hypothetical protein
MTASDVLTKWKFMLKKLALRVKLIAMMEVIRIFASLYI